MVTVSTSKSYHHGDLRAALLEAGLKSLGSAAVEDLSLRQIARDAGVSATAVYRHFPDKRALLSAMADTGIERLAQEQQRAAEAADEADAFAATGRAYVRFALAHPALFRLIFAYTCPPGETVFGNSMAARMLQDFSARYTASEEEARRLVIQAWAVVHGLAMLMLDGQLPADAALIDRVIDPQRLFNLSARQQ